MNNNLPMRMNNNLNMMNNANNMMNKQNNMNNKMMNDHMMNFNNGILNNNFDFDDDSKVLQSPVIKNTNLNFDETGMLNPIFNNLDDDNNSKIKDIRVIFRKSGSDQNGHPPVMIQCLLTDKVSDIIDKYRNKSNNHDKKVRFIFNVKNLDESLTVEEAGLTNFSSIFVVNMK